MISGVLSLDPSFTMIHSRGRMVCRTMLSMVSGRYDSSSRTGVTTTYRVAIVFARNSVKKIPADGTVHYLRRGNRFGCMRLWGCWQHDHSLCWLESKFWISYGHRTSTDHGD